MLKFESELRRNHDLLTKRREGFANEFFVSEGPVDLSGIEEGDTAFDCAHG